MAYFLTTLLISVAVFFLMHLTGFINVSGLALGASNWIMWLALFSVTVMILLFLKRPNRSEYLIDEFDTPIYTKPFFKVASVIIVIAACGMLFV